MTETVTAPSDRSNGCSDFGASTSGLREQVGTFPPDPGEAFEVPVEGDDLRPMRHRYRGQVCIGGEVPRRAGLFEQTAEDLRMVRPGFDQYGW